MTTKLSIGLSAESRHSVANSLNGLLADEYILYAKTRSFHWNVQGMQFHSLHLFYETQYEQLAQYIDDVAERIRFLGHFPASSLRAYLELTTLQESPRLFEPRKQMEDLLADHEHIIRRLRTMIKEFADRHSDDGSSDFVTALLENHEKMAWMIRAHISM